MMFFSPFQHSVSTPFARSVFQQCWYDGCLDMFETSGGQFLQRSTWAMLRVPYSSADRWRRELANAQSIVRWGIMSSRPRTCSSLAETLRYLATDVRVLLVSGVSGDLVRSMPRLWSSLCSRSCSPNAWWARSLDSDWPKATNKGELREQEQQGCVSTDIGEGGLRDQQGYVSTDFVERRRFFGPVVRWETPTPNRSSRTLGTVRPAVARGMARQRWSGT